MAEKIKKILAVASGGGHWIQLMRLKNAFAGCEVIYVSTHQGYEKMVDGAKFYKVTDGNRWSKINLLKMAFEIRKIVKTEKPDFIISTGAAPGLFALLWGKLSGSKTIWLDSIANVEKISLSGKIIRPFAHLHLTQWEKLAANKTIFKGNVIS